MCGLFQGKARQCCHAIQCLSLSSATQASSTSGYCTYHCYESNDRLRYTHCHVHTRIQSMRLDISFAGCVSEYSRGRSSHRSSFSRRFQFVLKHPHPLAPPFGVFDLNSYLESHLQQVEISLERRLQITYGEGSCTRKTKSLVTSVVLAFAAFGGHQNSTRKYPYS